MLVLDIIPVIAQLAQSYLTYQKNVNRLGLFHVTVTLIFKSSDSSQRLAQSNFRRRSIQFFV
jgi:hypothetical protein